jgi:predicted transcriptional regulator
MNFLHSRTTNSTARFWLLSNHGLVLLAVARDPTARICDYAQAVGITERACQRILNDLTEAGFVSRHRVGRRNHYHIHSTKTMRHPLVSMQQVSDLLDPLIPIEGKAVGQGARVLSDSTSP